MRGFKPISLSNRPKRGNMIMMPEWGLGVVTRASKEWFNTLPRHKKFLKNNGRPVEVFEKFPTKRVGDSDDSDRIWGGYGPFGENLFMVEADFPSEGTKRFLILVPEPTGITEMPKKGAPQGTKPTINGKPAHHMKMIEPFKIMVQI